MSSSKPLTDDDERHGTYAGRLAHYREGSTVCDPCREAFNAYQRSRRSDPDYANRERAANAATSRALWVLADRYRDEYERIRAEELTTIREERA